MRPLIERLRRLAVAVLTPLAFSRDTGHFRSSVKARALSRQGDPLPWYTYPAIDFLSTLDFSDARVLEFGSGQSSVWWANRARSLLSLEANRDWFTTVHAAVGVQDHVDIRFVEDPVEYARLPLGQTFDVVVIDGGHRADCAETALRVLAVDGIIVLDNSEGNWGPAGSYPVIDAYNEAGLARVDFHGYCPGVFRQQCTSLFFREIGPLTRLPPPARKYSAEARRPAGP